jgi:FkbM family methyltransferase
MIAMPGGLHSLIASFGLRRRHLGFPLFRIPLRFAVRNRLVSDYLLPGIPVPSPFAVRFPSGESFLYTLTGGEHIGESLYWKGAMSTEPDVVPVFLDHVRRCSRFIDVGANTGFYSLLAHAANAKIQTWAFEPNPAVFEKLRHHVEINGMAGSCQLYALAAGNATGSVKFQIPEDATMAHIAGPGEDGIEVPIRKLDDILPNEPVDLVKIDVEGHEIGVLRGMTNILATSRPAIFFECLPGSPSQEIEELFRQNRYRLLHLGAGGAQPIECLDPNNRTTHNFLALAQ